MHPSEGGHRQRRRLALALGVVGLVCATIPFLYLHSTGDGTLFIALAPVALVIGLVLVVVALTARPREITFLVAGAVLSLFAIWQIVGLLLFALDCYGVTESGSC